MKSSKLFKYAINLIWIIPICIYFVNKYYGDIESKIIITMQFEKKLKSDNVQIFFDRGNGYNGKDSKVVRITTNENAIGVARFLIEKSNNIRNIRLDPPIKLGKKIFLKKIKINIGKHDYILSQKELCKVKYLRNITDFKCQKNSISFKVLGNDPHFQIISNYQRLLDRKMHYIRMFLYIFSYSLLCFVVLVFFTEIRIIDKILNMFLKVLHPKHIYNVYLNVFILFIFTIVLIKTFTTLLSIFYYHNNISIFSMFLTYSVDILIATIFGIVGFLLLFLSRYFRSRHFRTILFLWLSRISKILQILIHLITVTLSVFMFIIVFYYLLSGYVFSEWGAFLEPQHIKALSEHDGTDEFLDMLFSIKTLFAIFFLGALFWSVKFFTYHLKYHHPKKMIISGIVLLLLFSILSLIPLNHLYKVKFSAKSPLLMITENISKNSKEEDPIDENLLKTINIKQFNPIEKTKILKNFINLKNSAKGMNVIFYIMESVRKKNVSLYGYHRNTMPTLEMLAKHSLVFNGAYVNQPRSCKTMASLLYGIYPDPRMKALTWEYSNLKNLDNTLIYRLLNNNYSLYFGTMQKHEGGDNFGDFIRKLSKNKVTIDDPSVLEKHNIYNRNKLDERLLTDNLLEWTKGKKKFAAILWTKSAHMPYLSPFKKFKENTKIDKYDNCLVNIDKSLKNLIEGLKKQGKLDNTLIIMFGDHGEAVADKMDWGHGNFLYEHSLNIPLVIYNNRIFKTRNNLEQRFQIKDISSTLLYLLGLNSSLNQSVNIFSKTVKDKIYLSNVYQDYKLGLIFDHYKFIYRPGYDMKYLFDLKSDPNENNNIINTLSRQKIKQLELEVLKWYKYQTQYIEKNILK